jgi:hypothetical protein
MLQQIFQSLKNISSVYEIKRVIHWF